MEQLNFISEDLNGLLHFIKKNLFHGDKRAVAVELGVSVQSICNVLSSKSRSWRILNALYKKAFDNKYCDKNPYSQKFIEKAILELK